MNNPVRRFIFLLVLVFALPVLASAQEEIIATSADRIIDPVFSPDGKQLAYVVQSGEKADLVLFDVTTKQSKTISKTQEMKRYPSFTSDSKTLYYCAKEKDHFDVFSLDLLSGKPENLTESPEDEFYAEAAHNKFILTDNASPTDRVFFLKGKDGKGTFEAEPSFPEHVKLLAGRSFNQMALGGQLNNIAFSDEKGLYLSKYIYLSSEYENTLAYGDPDEAILATGSTGLSLLNFAPDFVHLFARTKEGKTVIFDPRTGQSRPFEGNPDSRIACHPSGKMLAYVEKRENTFHLITKPVADRELQITNMYKVNKDINPFLVPAKEKLLQNGFVVIPDQMKQFHEVYENNRYYALDPYISADSVYFLFHLFYDFTLKQIEKGAFLNRIVAVSKAMAKEAETAFKKASKPESKLIYKKLWAFFSLAIRLADQPKTPETPKEIQSLVGADREKILAASDNELSAILDRKIDFSQFKVRGHYEETPQLGNYFRIMMLFSQLPLFVFDEKKGPSPDLPTILALYSLGSKAKLEKETALEALQKISDPLNFLVGETEDIGVIDLPKLLEGKVKIGNPDDINDPKQIKAAFDLLSAFPKPKIKPFQDVNVLFFPQRFTLDSYAMQRLTFQAVGTQAKPRWLPNMLDIMATLGSNRAEKILIDSLKAGEFANYTKNLGELKTEMNGLPETLWSSNIYRGWLKTFRDIVLLEGKTTESFTKSDAWLDRMLNAVLGSLTTLRHDTILYNKMSGAEAGEGGDEGILTDPPDVYVDPYPQLYGNLRRLTLELYARMTAQGLLPTQEIKEDSEEMYDQVFASTPKGLSLLMIKLLTRLEAAANKQMKGEPLSDREKMALMRYGIDLEHLSIAFSKTDEEFSNVMNEDLSLIADVHTGNGTCLETAIGRVFNLWVLHDRGNGERLYRGGVFSFFEFEQPTSNRLNDSEWKKMIRDNKTPAMPSWTKSFISGDLPKIELSPFEQEEGSKEP